MKSQPRNSSVFHAFECFRLDSAACGSDLFPVTPRSHYFSEVLLVRSGTCRIVRGSRTCMVSPGELLYIAPLIRHSIDSADGGPVVFDVIKYSATCLREIASYLPELRSIAMGAAYARLPVKMNAEDVKKMNAEDVKTWHIDSIFSECIIEYERQRFAWDLQIRALIYMLITNMARFCISKKEELTNPMPKASDPILEIPAFIEEHISEPLRVEDLARRCSLSYPWFARRFHDSFGLSCKQFIEHVRTAAVEQYLVYSDLDLAAISSKTGYTDCSHMVKDFRRMTGMTPGQFRSVMKIQGCAPFSRFSGQTEPKHPPKG